MEDNSYLCREEGYNILGAVFEVHKELGCGFLEKVYQEALAEEFILRGIPFEREMHIPISYKGKHLSLDYYADFVCYGKIIVELKAVSDLTSIHEAQLMNYLKATGYHVGYLVNFNEEFIKPIRMVI